MVLGSLFHVEIGHARLRIIERVLGSYLDAISARSELRDEYLESDRNHRIASANLVAYAHQSGVLLGFLSLAVQHAKLDAHDGRSLIHRMGLVNLGVQRHVIRGFETEGGGGGKLIPLA